MEKITCYVCKNNEAIQNTVLSFDGRTVECPQCGTYEIVETLIAATDNWKDVENKRHLLSHDIRNQNESGIIPRLQSDNINNHKNTPEFSFVEKINLLLLSASKSVNDYMDVTDFNNPKYIALTGSKNARDLQILKDFLEKKQWATYQGSCNDPPRKQTEYRWQITPEGWMHIDTLRAKRMDSKQGFVAMWFGNDTDMDGDRTSKETMTDLYEKGIKPAIEIQLDDQNNLTGLKALKINDKLHNGKIDDEIIAEIQRSRFVVADFTGHRGGVYFEAGYALGLGIPVIWTCRKDHFDNKEDNKYVHFDIRQYNFIIWETPEELRTKLYHRIRATVGV